MRLSIIIPTRGGVGGPVARCVRSLLDQLTPADEVIVSVDGGTPDPALDVLARAHPVRVLGGAAVGPGGARNRGLRVARASVVLFLNDDVVARPGLLDAHAAFHAGTEGRGAMMLGAAPWRVRSDDRVVDRLLRETSWIFFYDRMAEDPARDWGFRHAWTLNLSLPRDAAAAFDERLAFPMFDDLEWAWRVGLPVRYRPGAVVEHEHRYTAMGLLRREALLGHQAAVLHGLNPACAAAAFGDRYRPGAAGGGVDPDWPEAFRAFEAMAERPAEELDAPGEVGRMFEACRGWREAARRLGAEAAFEGGSGADAMARAERALAGAAVVGGAA